MSAKNNGRRETDSFHNEVAFITFFKIMGPKIPSFTYYFNIFLVLFQSYVSSSLVSPHSAFESSSEKLLSAVESPMHSSYAGSPVIFRKSSPPPTVPMTTLDSFDGGPTSVSSTSGCGTATEMSSDEYFRLTAAATGHSQMAARLHTPGQQGRPAKIIAYANHVSSSTDSRESKV